MNNNISEENETQNTISVPPRNRKRGPRKRFKDESSWKRNIRKKLRNSGKEYINSKQKIVPEKQFNNSDCDCIKGCQNQISLDQRNKIFSEFYALGDHNLQTSFLCGQIKLISKLRSTTAAVSKRKYTRIYYLLNEHGVDVPVCKSFFKKTLQVSDGRLTRALKGKQIGQTPTKDRRGQNTSYNKTTEKETQGVLNFIKKFPKYQSHYSRSKNMNKLYLAPNLNMSIMYELYKTDCPEPVSKFIFRQIFRTKFNLSFHPPITDSCKLCDNLEQKIKFEVNEEQLNEFKVTKELHLRKAEAARSGMKKDAELGKSPDNDVTVIAFDLMSTLPTPHLSTGVCYYKRQLWTYCLGIHNLSTNVAHMYVWNESQGSRGPQEIGTCLIHYIKNFVFTSKLIMYSDQCGGQNRNIKIAVLCKYILESELSVLNQIDHKFLVSGHSFMPCDQDFGVIEKNKKFVENIYVPDDWVRVIKTARKKNPFTVTTLTKQDFISTAALEKSITNRKKSAEDGSINWLKIQWLRYTKNDTYNIFYKDSNQEDVLFAKINIKKRNVSLYNGELEVLNPHGRKIDQLKYSNLMDLLPYVPPIYHEFYTSLQVNTTTNSFEEVDENTDILELHCVNEDD